MITLHWRCISDILQNSLLICGIWSIIIMPKIYIKKQRLANDFKWQMIQMINDKWLCRFMTNDPSLLNVMLASIIVLACIMFCFGWFFYFSSEITWRDINQSKSNDWNTKDYVSFDQMTPNPKNGQMTRSFPNTAKSRQAKIPKGQNPESSKSRQVRKVTRSAHKLYRFRGRHYVIM